MTILKRYRLDIDLPWKRHRGLPALEWMVLPLPFELDASDVDLAPVFSTNIQLGRQLMH